MKRWWHPKVCSALVFCGAVAVLLTTWRIDSAGKGAVAGEGGCSVDDLQYRAVHLEMARTPARVREILAGVDLESCGSGQPRSARCLPPDLRCLRGGVEAQVHGDNRLLLAYSALTLALFLFVGSFRFSVPEGGRPTRWAAFAFFGLLLALAMGLADFAENRRLLELIRLAGSAAPAADAEIAALLPGLREASGVKLGSLALSALVLGLLWPSVSRRWLVWTIRLLAGSAAVYLALALYGDDAPKAICGVALLSLFWLAALVHAVLVAVQREVEIPEPAGQQAQVERKKEEGR